MDELYTNSNIIKKANSNDIASNSYSSSNYRITSQIIMSSQSEEDSSRAKFQSLKRILSESFEIKSSYQNLNILSKGEIIKNEKFKRYLENSINTYFNKYEEEEKKESLSLFSSQNLNYKKKKIFL